MGERGPAWAWRMFPVKPERRVTEPIDSFRRNFGRQLTPYGKLPVGQESCAYTTDNGKHYRSACFVFSGEFVHKRWPEHGCQVPAGRRGSHHGHHGHRMLSVVPSSEVELARWAATPFSQVPQTQGKYPLSTQRPTLLPKSLPPAVSGQSQVLRSLLFNRAPAGPLLTILLLISQSPTELSTRGPADQHPPGLSLPP